MIGINWSAYRKAYEAGHDEERGTCYKLNEGTLPVDQIQCI